MELFTSPIRYIQVTVTYKGEKKDKSFFDKNIELKKLYPTQEEFNAFYKRVLSNLIPNRISWIYISENNTMDVQYLSLVG